MGIAFVLSVSAAFAFKPASQKVFTARFQLVGASCNAIQTPDCDGPSTNVLCTDIFSAKNLAQQCVGATYRTTNP